MYASPLTSSSEQTHRLFNAAETRHAVTLIVRIEIREPTQTKDFRGFFFFFFQKKKEKPKDWNWCFVVEQVLDGEVSIHYGEQRRQVRKIEVRAGRGRLLEGAALAPLDCGGRIIVVGSATSDVDFSKIAARRWFPTKRLSVVGACTLAVS